MFYFRINKIKIFNNREEGLLFGLLGPDRAQVKILSFVTTSNAEIPALDELVLTNDESRKREIVRSAVTKVVASRELMTIENVKDNQTLYFGDANTGYVLFASQEIPADFNWAFLVLESDRNIRSIGQQLENVLNDSEFSTFTENLGTLIAGASSPAFVAGVAIGKFVTGVVARAMKQNKDDMIGMIYMSLNRRQHYPYGERKRDKVPDLTNNMLVDYSIFGF